MKVLVTGAGGFIGKNLCLALEEHGGYTVTKAFSDTPLETTEKLAQAADVVFHIAGVNRPQTEGEFRTGNADLTQALCHSMAQSDAPARLILTSSRQAADDNAYGLSKRAAEDHAFSYAKNTGAEVFVFRLTNVFGKWARPNYNSAVATFCYNLTHDLPIKVNDPNAPLTLVYIDDVVSALMSCISAKAPEGDFVDVSPTYDTTVGDVAAQLEAFAENRTSLVVGETGVGLSRALHATYLSYLEPDAFDYSVPIHADPRGAFVEMLKTPQSGQLSYFTAGPGITRGEHYHHTKTEKFLIVKGTAEFRFRNLADGRVHTLVVQGEEGRIVETAPGWVHLIKNIGTDELITMLWANEIFDKTAPDTYAAKVDE